MGIIKNLGALLLSSAIFVGCNYPDKLERRETPPVPRDHPAQSIPPSYGPWESEDRDIRIDTASLHKFEVDNLSIKVTGEHTSDISGRVRECSYNAKVIESRKVYGPNYPNGYNVETRTLFKKVDWMSPPLQFISEYAPTTDIPVAPTGEFSLKIRSLDNFYFKEPLDTHKYFRVVAFSEPAKIQVKHWTLNRLSYNTSPHGSPVRFRGSFFDYEISLPVWTYEIDKDAIKDFVEKSVQTTKVYLEALDKITRLPITPKIRITPIDAPTKSDLEKKLFGEFRDENLTAIALNDVPSYLGYDPNSKILEDVTQGIDFDALIGSTYKVETFHNNYFYFSGYIKANNNPTKKSVLLIEKGAKVRVEGVKDGEGGEIIDTR
ncbi:hypothetical protein HYV49_03905 [Candidatus Pacearchaeota archaeon]|nr:hypothetical protein [Candidatus Pacearchaeota archaeon]